VVPKQSFDHITHYSELMIILEKYDTSDNSSSLGRMTKESTGKLTEADQQKLEM